MVKMFVVLVDSRNAARWKYGVIGSRRRLEIFGNASAKTSCEVVGQGVHRVVSVSKVSVAVLTFAYNTPVCVVSCPTDKLAVWGNRVNGLFDAGMCSSIRNVVSGWQRETTR